MINPRDEFEAELYARSDTMTEPSLRYLLIGSVVAFGPAVILIVAGITAGNPSGGSLVQFGSLLLFTGGALLLGWLFGVSITAATRLVEWVR